MRIIVNADDLGYSVDRDELSFSLMEAGKVTSATLMTVAPNFENIAPKVKTIDNISFGIHLTLTEFQLISDNPMFRNIGVTNTENYVISDIRKAKIRPFSAIQNAIFDEWKLQIEKALDYGINISHLDSHHHIHTAWWVFPVIKKIQKHFEIRRLRNPKQCFLFEGECKRPNLVNKFRRFLFRYYYLTKTPDYFTSFEEGFRFLTKKPHFDVDATVEMMCHPGNPVYESETKLLLTDWLDDFKKRYEMINYSEI
jgi:predicted glycoside hydrolase/deacetylase ChbG (UPF0249 family)